MATPGLSSGSVGTGAVSVEALELFVEVLSRSDVDGGGTDDFYDRLSGAICQLAHMRRALIFRYDSSSRRVRAVGAHGLDLSVFTGVHVSIETASIAANALGSDQVLEMAGDLGEHFPAEYRPLVAEPMRLFCTPMIAAGRAVGVILTDREFAAPPLDAAERQLLWTLGKAAALASVVRSVATQAETSRQLQHRINLAREVHEGVVQRLFGVSMALDGDGDLPAQARTRAAAETQAALTELRETLQRPLGRSPRATATTLAAEVERLAQVHPGIGLAFTDLPQVAVPTEAEPLAQSVLGEAVRNAVKHAHPTAVSVRTENVDGAFTLEVINDGVGAGAGHPPGMGLRLAAFEALQQGGVVEFGPGAPGTWQVRLVVPIASEGDGHDN
jgi:signal transduction histidine kinase